MPFVLGGDRPDVGIVSHIELFDDDVVAASGEGLQLRCGIGMTEGRDDLIASDGVLSYEFQAQAAVGVGHEDRRRVNCAQWQRHGNAKEQVGKLH